MKKEKVKTLIRRTQKAPYRLGPDDIHDIILLANAHPRWSVKKIFEYVLRPKMRTALMVRMSIPLEKGLQKASEKQKMRMDDLVYEIIEEWLKARNFLKAD